MPKTTAAQNNTIMLPMFAQMTTEQVDHVASTLDAVLVALAQPA